MFRREQLEVVANATVSAVEVEAKRLAAELAPKSEWLRLGGCGLPLGPRLVPAARSGAG